MYTISIEKGGHQWEKQNLVTLTDKRGQYDLMKCGQCGITGRKYDFNFIKVSESFGEPRVRQCAFAPIAVVPTQVKVIHCSALGKQFKNLTPGSVHAVVDPPEGQKNDPTGVWVMGVGEPVRLLTREISTL